MKCGAAPQIWPVPELTTEGGLSPPMLASTARVQQPRAEPSAPRSAVFILDAVRCFIFDKQSRIKMGDEATIEFGFYQD